MAMRVRAVSLLLSALASGAIEIVTTDLFTGEQCATLTHRLRVLSNECQEHGEWSKKVTCNGTVATTHQYMGSGCLGTPRSSYEAPSNCNYNQKVTCGEEEVGPVAGMAVQEITYETEACGEVELSRAEDPRLPSCRQAEGGSAMMACDSDDTWALFFFSDPNCKNFKSSAGGPADACAAEDSDGVYRKRLCVAPASFQHMEVASYSSADCTPGTRTQTVLVALDCMPYGTHNETTSTWTQGSHRRSVEEGKVKYEVFASRDCSGAATSTGEESCGCHPMDGGSYGFCDGHEGKPRPQVKFDTTVKSSDISSFDLEDFQESLQAGADGSTVKIESVRSEIKAKVEFDANITKAEVRQTMAMANGFPESDVIVEVVTSRRLSAGRRLAGVEYDVTMVTEDLEKAKAAMQTSNNAAALSAALRSINPNATAVTVTEPPVAEIVVTTVMTSADDTDPTPPSDEALKSALSEQGVDAEVVVSEPVTIGMMSSAGRASTGLAALALVAAWAA